VNSPIKPRFTEEMLLYLLDWSRHHSCPAKYLLAPWLPPPKLPAADPKLTPMEEQVLRRFDLPCMANNPTGTKLGQRQNHRILSLEVVPFKGADHIHVGRSS